MKRAGSRPARFDLLHVQLDGSSMQPFASFIDVATAPPNASAAIAIAPPTMARISAYSAAEAPDWSFSILINVFMVSSLQSFACRVGRQASPRGDRRKLNSTKRLSARDFSRVAPRSPERSAP